MSQIIDFLNDKYIYKQDMQLRFLLKEFTIPEIVAEIMHSLKNDGADFFDLTGFARDFYIGSDLTDNEKKIYYNELKNAGFFELLNRYLYDENFGKASWAIYTFGKFSEKENAHFLEDALENHYFNTNPLLVSRCMTELDWLDSEKFPTYLEILEIENSESAFLSLLYMHNTFGDDEMQDFYQNKLEKFGYRFQDDRTNLLFRFENFLGEKFLRKPFSKEGIIKLAKSFFR